MLEFGKTLAKLEFSRAPYLSKGLVGEIIHLKIGKCALHAMIPFLLGP